MYAPNTMPRSLSVLLVAVVAALIALPSVAAAVEPRGPVPSHALVGSTDLFGLSEAEARSAITTGAPLPVMAPLEIVCLGVTRAVDPAGAVSVDVEAMLDAAYSSTATDTYALAPIHRVDQTVVRGWIALSAAGIDTPATDARYVVTRRRLRVIASTPGRRVDADAGAAAVSAALLAQASGGGLAQPPVTLVIVPVAPRVHESSMPRALLVVLGERKLYSYRVGGGLEKTYRCAIGMSRYQTPRGTFRIIGKKVNPSWTNPGSRWARSMPRYIRPGPRNPLGTRALYLNAPGIRIHGTAASGSIGRAASHGCVRMLRRDIEALFPKIPVGTQVFIVK
jgi:lipoprotein-anchoring transpeptidase ErfK/SrfK